MRVLLFSETSVCFQGGDSLLGMTFSFTIAAACLERGGLLVKEFQAPESTHRLHGSSFLGVHIQNPIRCSQKGTTMEPMGRVSNAALRI